MTRPDGRQQINVTPRGSGRLTLKMASKYEILQKENHVKLIIDHKYGVRCRSLYEGCIALIKLLIFVVDLPAKRSSFGRFQIDPTYTPLVHDAYRISSETKYV